jgi:hypothetical protein
VRAGQPLQQPLRLRKGGAGERRRSPRGDVWARHQAEQPEQPPGSTVQGGVGGVERHPHRGLGVAVHGQLGQPVTGT